MRILIPLLAAVLLGCLTSLDHQTETESDGVILEDSLILRTDRQSYTRGDPVRLILENRTGGSVAGNLCFAQLERRADERWVRQETLSDEICPAILRLFGPGETASHVFRLGRAIPASEYRFRATLELDARETVEQLSNTFRMHD